ncbi:MAG: mechanosensitive ion channel domain-containing protein, partial [Acidobacteriaceae bacterium]
FIGVQSLGVNLDSLVIFGGALGVGVGLGLQNVVSNFVAGLILLVEQPIRIGDRIETSGILGDVVKIAARSTWIRTNDNVVIIVPNNQFIDSSVTNWTANDPNVRISLDVGVGYASDPQLVRTLLLQAADRHPDILRAPAPDWSLRSTAIIRSISNFAYGLRSTHTPRQGSNLIFTSPCSNRSQKMELNCRSRSGISIFARRTYLSLMRDPKLTRRRDADHRSYGAIIVRRLACGRLRGI